MSGRWYAGLPSCRIEVDCGGARHTVRWRKGRVILEDHDVVAELALAALGGEGCPCLELLTAWRHGIRQPDTVRWLRDAPTPPSPEGLSFFAQSQGWFTTVSQTRSSAVSAASVAGLRRRRIAHMEQRMRQQQLRQLLSTTGPQWLHRAATAAAVHGLRRPGAGEAGVTPEEKLDLADVLRDCAVSALEESIRRWRGPRARRQHFFIECHPFDGAGPALIGGSVDDHVGLATVSLPLRWLVDVWSRNAALIDECFALSARLVDGATLAVAVVRWERDRSGRSFPVISSGTARRIGDHWRLVEPEAFKGVRSARDER